MRLLFLSLFFHCDLLHCVEFVEANFPGFLETGHELKARRHDYYMNSRLTPGTHQTDQITPQNSILTTPPDGFLLPIRRNQKTPQRKISNRQLKNNSFRHQTRAIVRQGVTVPQISKRRYPEESDEGSSDVKAGALHRTRRTQTTVTKQRLKPGLLLGKATIGDESSTDDEDDDDEDDVDDDDFKKITSESDESKKIMRMHDIAPTTKKQWYSDRPEVQKEVMRTATPTTRMQYAIHTMFPPLSTASSVTLSYNKMIEFRQDTHMIVFLTELARLVATKEKKAVHDVLKHTNQIIHGFFKSGKLQWFAQPLTDFTKKVAKLLKKSEPDVIQKQAANLHHILRLRTHMVSDEVNRIIEYADRLYDDDEGEHLLEALNEFAEYPNTSLTGYWLCNSLIYNFLRPYRRLADTPQRQQLIDSVNKALKLRFTSGRANETSDDKGSSHRVITETIPINKTLTKKEPSYGTTQTPIVRNKKRRHRSHKRKRKKKRIRMHRPLSDKENLMLRSMAPGTSVQPTVLVTT